jgi:hypothetical protein
MQNRMVVVAVLAWSAVGGLSACGSDDSSVSAPVDSGMDDHPDVASGDSGLSSTEGGAIQDDGGDDSGSAVLDATVEDAASESGIDASIAETGSGDTGVAEAAAGDTGIADADASALTDAGTSGDGGVATYLLLSYNGGSQSEVAAFGLASKQVDGRLLYPGFIGTTYPGPTAPWLLEQSADVVAELDPARPWTIDSSWNVALHDRRDGGESYSDPDAVVVGAGSKAYVLRYTRNEIAIVDAAAIADGGAPVGTIDLSDQLQAAGDGTVEMSAGVYVPSKNLVYVLLANINRGNVACGGYCLLCADTHPTVVAIDVATDAVVDLNGSAAGVSLQLSGYNPGLGIGAMAYDSVSDRLLVLEAGCNDAAADGGAGALVGREVEELSLFTGRSRRLLDLRTAAYPSQLTYIDSRRAIVQLDTAYSWDPTSTRLGPAIPNAPDSFVWDGVANLIGITARYSADGGVFSGYDVVSVRMADGNVTKLGTNPFSLTGGFPAGVELWPTP